MTRAFFDKLPEPFDSNLWGSFIAEKGFRAPTDVQAQAVGTVLKGESLEVLAKTGSGKTLAYALPLVQRLKEWEKEEGSSTLSASPRIIVLQPTRELASQVLKVFKELSHHAKFRPRQLKGGGRGRAAGTELMDILVANPGNLLAAVKDGDIFLRDLRALVLDEADQLMDMGFAKDIQKVREFAKGELQTLLVTATRPDNFSTMGEELFPEQRFQIVDLLEGDSLQRHIETYNVSLEQGEKPAMLREFLQKRAQGCGIVFVNKKYMVEQLRKELGREKESGELKKPVQFLHGEMPQAEREKAFKTFQKKKGVLVATDILARGIDLPDIEWVLNYDLPFEAVYYLHRCGRTGRAASQGGEVVNFVTPRDKTLMGKINKAIADQQVLALSPIKEEARSSKGQKSAKSQTSKHGKEKKSEKRKKIKRTPRYKKK